MSKLRRGVLLLCTALCLVGGSGRESRAAKVDFLWIVDNSPSMAGEQSVLSAAADDIANQLANARCPIDWRMAVAYTDLHLPPSATDTCPGAPGPGRRRLCPFTTDLNVFRNGTPQCAYVKAGTCGDASERGFNGARVAIDRLLAGTGCEPVPGGDCTLRPDAQLAVIFMTDTGDQTTDTETPPGEPDNSVPSWVSYFSDYDLLRPAAQRSLVDGIVCPLRPTVDNPAPCSDRLEDPVLFDRYSQVIAGMGGTEGSIRNDDMMQLNDSITRIVDAAIVGACCGNGIVDPGEDCDDGNQLNGDCCSSNCKFEPPTTVCRPAAGPCDVAELCTGTSGQCPADTLKPSTFKCRPAAGPCDAAERCTGTDAACPADAKKTSDVCRPATGPCDVDERCDGTHDGCPADGFKAAGTECRAAAGVCDAAESCTGSDAACPADVKKNTDLCRTAAGPCDVDERCDGTHDACPADGFKAAGTECRAAAGVCDTAESCTGSDAACPADAKKTDVCRQAAGPCDVDERCDGTHDSCPADGFKAAGAECRAAAGVCDAAESCTGSDAACPADAKKTSDVCRPAAGPCDVEERCDGTRDDCPADAFRPATVTCRDAAGVCDAPELCTGSSAGCPADAKKTEVCRPAAGQCDALERCDGASDDCPSDHPSPDGTPCNDGNACTQTDACQAGICTGVNPVRCNPPDQCHDAGACDPATGTCSNPAKADGTGCNDGIACTWGDVCQAGVCAGAPATCAPPDECDVAACNPSTGACSMSLAPDG